MKTIAKSYPHEGSGSKIHLVYDKKSKVVQFSVWESPTGLLVALSNDWMADHQSANIDPVPELLEVYETFDREE